MKFDDLKKWQKLLIYMYTHNDMYTHNFNDAFTAAKNGDDVIKYGIVKNKNALYSMINDLREKSYIYNPGDGYFLTDNGYYYCDDLYPQISSCCPWDIDEDEYSAQPNSSENFAATSTNDSMKNAFESMAQSFKSMAQSFNSLGISFNKQNDNNVKDLLDSSYQLACNNDAYIAFIISHIDTVVNAIRNGTKSPKEIIETLMEIYSDGINPLVKNNSDLKNMLSPE